MRHVARVALAMAFCLAAAGAAGVRAEAVEGAERPAGAPKVMILLVGGDIAPEKPVQSEWLPENHGIALRVYGKNNLDEALVADLQRARLLVVNRGASLVGGEVFARPRRTACRRVRRNRSRSGDTGSSWEWTRPAV